MSKTPRYCLYALMIAIGLIAMYTLLNAGSPHSLLRHFLPDPKDDVYVAMVSSVLVFILGFFVFFARDREGFHQLIELNGDKIRRLRRDGRNDEEIADAILEAVGSIPGGYRHNLARKKLIVYLAGFR